MGGVNVRWLLTLRFVPRQMLCNTRVQTCPELVMLASSEVSDASVVGSSGSAGRSLCRIEYYGSRDWSARTLNDIYQYGKEQPKRE